MTEIDLKIDLLDFKAINFVPKVYVRESWVDPWEKIDNLYCDKTVRTVSPSIGSAQFSYDIGKLLHAGSGSKFKVVEPKELNRWFVKVDPIVSGDGFAPPVWYGVIVKESRDILGRSAGVDSLAAWKADVHSEIDGMVAHSQADHDVSG